MKLNKLATILAEYSYNLGLDLQKYVEVQTGKGYFKDAQYQQVQLPDPGNQSYSDNEQSQQDTVKTEGQDQQYDDFHMEIDQPCGGSGSSIKTYQFNSGFIAPSKPIGSPIEHPPQLSLLIQQHFGYNSKQKQSCILLSPNNYVISVGCTIVLVPLQKQKNKQYKLYQQHVYEITALYYCKQNKLLLTGSKGIKPQIVVWRVEQKEGQKQKGNAQLQIKFVNKFYMDRKVEGVGLIRMLNNDIMLVVDCLSIHCGNQIRAYDIQAGLKLNFHKKFTQKIMEMQVDKKQRIYLGTNKGITKISNALSNNPLIQTISTIPNIMSMSITQNMLIVGNQKQTIYILSMEGKEIQKIQIHQGFVFNVDVVPIMTSANANVNVSGKKSNRYLLASCGTKDNCARISIVDEVEEGKRVKVADFATVEMKSYCTAISWVDDQNVLLGWRDGSIVIFDAKNKVKKYEKLSTISCVKSNNACFTAYNALTQKIAFNYKNQIFNLNPSRIQGLSSSKSNLIKKTPSITLLPIKQINNLNCFWVYKEKMAQVYASNKKKYLLQILDLTQNNKNQVQPLFSIQLNLQKQGKPRLVRFNQDFVTIGTKYGYVVIVAIKSGVIVISSEKHDESVEDIVFQQGKWKEKQSFYLKTVSGSQLLHWQLKLDSEVPTIAPIKKTTQIKNLEWTSLCKYCWETKNIWQEMTHYQDIESVTLVGSKVKNICVSMVTGVLRVYRFPATRNNYIEFKLFPSKFRLFACGKQNQMLLCQYNLQFLLIELNDKEEEK